MHPLAKECESSLPLAPHHIISDFYVDDFLLGADILEEASILVNKSTVFLNMVVLILESSEPITIVSYKVFVLIVPFQSPWTMVLMMLQKPLLYFGHQGSIP